ncbi:MAG: low temperature requirement protein A [Vicinamibacterales bacterium]
MQPFVIPFRLRTIGTAESVRKVTWLELFFDLIFVGAVAQVAQPLREEYSFDGLLRFSTLFALIWWAWMGYTVFATRFDTDDGVQRALTWIQMFVVAVMAANAREALGSRSAAGFAAAYAAGRLLLCAQYLRARRVQEARALTTTYLIGHALAAVLWLGSAFLAAPTRFWIWGVAFVVDLGTPWTARRHSVAVPPHAAHLPERLGLFTLILLGESVVAVMQGMESQADWTAAAATTAFTGIGIAFLLWWWYFDGALAAAEQPVRTRHEASRLQAWTYAHFPFYLGVVLAGVGVQRVVASVGRASLPPSDVVIFSGALALAMLALTVIGATSAGRRECRGHHVVLHVLIAGAVLGVGGRTRGPVVLMVAAASFCALQLAISLAGLNTPRRQLFASEIGLHAARSGR